MWRFPHSFSFTSEFEDDDDVDDVDELEGEEFKDFGPISDKYLVMSDHYTIMLTNEEAHYLRTKLEKFRERKKRSVCSALEIIIFQP